MCSGVPPDRHVSSSRLGVHVWELIFSVVSERVVGECLSRTLV